MQRLAPTLRQMLIANMPYVSALRIAEAALGHLALENEGLAKQLCKLLGIETKLSGINVKDAVGLRDVLN